MQTERKEEEEPSYIFFAKLQFHDTAGGSTQKIMHLTYLTEFIAGLTNIVKVTPKTESKLTNIFAGILSSRVKPVKISFLAHINPLDINNDQTLFSLQYQDKLKKCLLEDSVNVRIDPYEEHIATLGKLMERVAKENENLNS